MSQAKIPATWNLPDTGRDLLKVFVDNPWGTLLRFVLTVFIITRTITHFRSSLRPAEYKSSTKVIPRLSYWIPYIANTPLFYYRPQSWLLELSERYQSNVFGLTLSGRNHVVVVSPALLVSLTDASSPVHTREYDRRRRMCFFGHRNASGETSDRVSKALSLLSSDSTRTTKLTRLLEAHSYNFISPSKSWVDQAQWERNADVKIIETTPMLSVSVSLSKLVREFSAHVVLSALLSTSFVEANSSFIGDFFSFSPSYHLFMTGLPYWIAPGLGPPALSREKCLLALDSLVSAIMAELDGKSMTGTGAGMLYDLEDVHPAIWSIVRQAKTEAKTNKPTNRNLSAQILEIVWNTTFSSANIITWLLVYLFGQEGENRLVLEEIKAEIQKVVQVEKPKPTGLPFEDPPRMKFTPVTNENKVEKTCPSLYGAILEILRLETEPEEYSTVQEDFILSADATPDPTSTKKPALLSNIVERYQLRKGDHVYAAYGATNKDTYYWDRPRRFAPNRYDLTASGNDTRGKGSVLSRMKSPHQFICISESMYVVIALLSFYEFEIQKHTGTRMVAGVGTPKGNLKAPVTRRKL